MSSSSPQPISSMIPISRSEPPPRPCEWPACGEVQFPFTLRSEARGIDVWYPGDPYCEEHTAIAKAAEERAAIEERLVRCKLPKKLRGYSWECHMHRTLDRAGAANWAEAHGGKIWKAIDRDPEGVLPFKARVEARSQAEGRLYIGVTPENYEAFAALYSYHPDRETGKLPARSMIIHGTVGTGKTTLLACTVEALVRWRMPGKPADQQGVRVLYATETALYRAATEEGRVRDGAVSLLDRARTAELVAIDDFGAGEMLQQRHRDVLEHLVQDRYDEDLPMLITTNLTLPQILRKYGSRTGSRLAEMCSRCVVQLVGADWRSGEEPEMSAPAEDEPKKRRTTKRRKGAQDGGDDES